MSFAYVVMKSTTSGIVMKPSGSSPEYAWPGSRHCQLGVSSRNESQRSVRHELATSLRSSTTWSMARSDRQRLIASPPWPAPITTVVVRTASPLVPMIASPSGSAHSAAQRPQALTSTSTSVGLVMMSYTADRFCDWATRALMSSSEASASIWYFTLMLLKPLRMSVSMPRMPRTSMPPSTVAMTLFSWMLRFCATAAMPAVRHPARPTSMYSTGVAPLSSEAKISVSPTSNEYLVRSLYSAPSPKKPSTFVLLCVPFSHSHDARHMNWAASGAAPSASRAPRSASTLTPLLTGVSVVDMDQPLSLGAPRGDSVWGPPDVLVQCDPGPMSSRGKPTHDSPIGRPTVT